MSVAAPMPIMDLSVSAADLQKVFDAYNNFPRGPSRFPILEMELKKFHKLVRDVDLFGPSLSPVDLDLILLKCRPRGWKKLCLPHFGAALEAVAKRVGVEASEIINKVIEQGGPLPSAPVPAEWKNISPHITQHSPRHDGSCCERHLAESQRSKREGLGSGAQERRLLLQSSEWTQLREEREAVRRRFGAGQFAARQRGPGTRTTSMTAAFGSSASRLGQPLYLAQSESKASGGRASRTAGRGAPHTVGPSSRTQSFHSGAESRTPAGPHASLRGSSSEAESPVTPFVITDTGTTTASFSYQVVVTSSSYKTPQKTFTETAEKITDLRSAFAFFCTLSHFKEHEPSLLKLPPQMNQAEFRRLCRECNLLQGGGSELPDVTFHVTTTRSKTKFMDFAAFLFALERIALSMHLSFADMEGRITSAAERLHESGEV